MSRSQFDPFKTDEDGACPHCGADLWPNREYLWCRVRAALRRCATGEPPRE